eukprot:Gb_20413 [translate_table: standard]
MDLNTLEQRLQCLVMRAAPANATENFVRNAASPAGTVITGFPHMGNLSPMSPTPVSDISGVSTIGTRAMVHDHVTMEGMFSAGVRVGIEHGNISLATDNTAFGIGSNIYSCSGVNMLSQRGQPHNKFQSQHGIGDISMSTGNRMMPMNATSYCGVKYGDIDSMEAVQIRENKINGRNPNYHTYCDVNGQIVDTMGVTMQPENSSYAYKNGGTNSGMQCIGNYNTSNASECDKVQMPSKQHFNQQQHQYFTCNGYYMDVADFTSNRNLCNSPSSYGPANPSGLCVNSVRSHLSNGVRSEQNSFQAQKQVDPNKFKGLDNSQHVKFPISSHVFPRDHFLRSQKHQQQQYKQQQQKFQQHPHHPQHHQQKQQNFMPQQQQQPNFQQLQDQHQHQQIQQQQLLSNNNGAQLAQSPSKFFQQKQKGIGLSYRELQQREHQYSKQHPIKQLQLPDKSLQVQESRGWQVRKNSIGCRQLHPQHTQTVQQMQSSSPQQQPQTRTRDDTFSLSTEAQPNTGWQEQQDSKPLENPQFSHQAQAMEQQKQSQKHIQWTPATNRDEAHHHLCSQPASIDELIPTINAQTRDSTTIEDTEPPGQSSGTTEAWQHQYSKDQQWLFSLHHASKCSDAVGECQAIDCPMAKLQWEHITKCHNPECLYPRCVASRTLLSHHQHCRDQECVVCVPFHQSISQQQDRTSNSGLMHFTNDTAKSVGACDTDTTNARFPSRSVITVHGGQSQESPLKKAKFGPASSCDAQKQVEAQQESILNSNNMQMTSQMQPHACQQGGKIPGLVTCEAVKSFSSQQGIIQRPSKTKKDVEAKHEPVQWEKSLQALKSEPTTIGSSKATVQVKQEVMPVKQGAIRMASHSDNSATAKLGKSKTKGVSLMELFTPEQIKDHITGLRQWMGQNRGKAENNQAMKHQMKENTCQLCMGGSLKFEPPPIYCTPCGARIRRNAIYYTAGVGVTRNYFCITCYNEIRDDTIGLDGVTYVKSKLEKRKNEEETEESWVQCDKCEAWQHQICALFNARRNESGQADYTCPNCYMEEIERGARKPVLQSAVLGAKDLPRTYLSDHIEQRLFRRLKEERQERARALGKAYDEVPGAESLVVRVVSSVDKKVEVKQHFVEIFQDENYPIELPYRSKVLLLFQRIEGVEVCLFGMYVQEFGSDCSQPNQRQVSLSYLDSVKYFRPDVKTVTGEALRTLVYHEILIGYLDYCKKRGFMSCYIWACPPWKGEDYILYCHPEIQKTPKSDKLRQWYLTMLSKAIKEDIVLDVTNFYDYFFMCTGECKAKVTAARLPYFDGDYWPGAIEDVIMQLQPQQKKWKTKRSAIKKPAPQAEFASNSSKDALLMQKLGESSYAMKEDFIIVHMHHTCTHCRLFILSGKRWVCNKCKNYQLCDKCYEADVKLDEEDMHPINSKEKHVLCPIEVTDVPLDTKDKDEIMESEFFDTRQAFLSLCQGNHYQYDTLRRAKHSSMMILYHLHNPTAPAFVSTCNVCYYDIETGQGWRCETCPDFDICNACYQNDEFVGHPHKMIAHPSMAELNAQNKEARQQRVLQLRKMLDLLVHASQCCSPQCQYENCRRVKGLFRHGKQCKIRASGGCSLCRKMWYLLQLHGRACKESECRVPHCKDLKKHLQRLQQQMESRRRAAVMEMMRQCAPEVSGNSS